MTNRVDVLVKRIDGLEQQTHRRVLKTHLPVDALVFSPKAKYIYIGRDARDVVWSLYNHHVNANALWYQALNDTPGRVGPPIGPPAATVQQCWREWMDGDGYPFWPFWDNVRTWWAIRHLPNVLFIHFAITDGMGHSYGWLSPQQFSVLFRADEALKQFLDELDARNLRNETLFIVTADHGGHGSTHGSNSPEDMTIPWIAAGPGIQSNKALTALVHTMDTAATAAFALGLSIPAEWDGVPVYEAFGLPVVRQSFQCR